MNKDSAYKLALSFDADSMSKQLLIISEDLWNAVIPNNITSNFWEGVALRSCDGTSSNLQVGDNYYDTPLMKVLPVYEYVINSFRCELKRVRLLKLKPGGVIGKHRDIFPGEIISEVRLQLPIVTNKDALFIIDNVSYNIQPGEVWYFDVSKNIVFKISAPYQEFIW